MPGGSAREKKRKKEKKRERRKECLYVGLVKIKREHAWKMSSTAPLRVSDLYLLV